MQTRMESLWHSGRILPASWQQHWSTRHENSSFSSRVISKQLPFTSEQAAYSELNYQNERPNSPDSRRSIVTCSTCDILLATVLLSPGCAETSSICFLRSLFRRLTWYLQKCTGKSKAARSGEHTSWTLQPFYSKEKTSHKTKKK